jgi:aspartokinase-like uncharacterized kinase
VSAPALVVKLGGGSAASPLLGAWLAAIEAAAGRIVLVPGGGPFADAVRAAQATLGFGDAAAHAMALLAMAQYAIFLTARGTLLTLAADEDAIARACAAGRVPVWTPPVTLGPADGVPASWDATSDSLSLWLAQRLGAPRLLLIKPRAGGAELLDAAFGGMRTRYPGRVFIAGPDHLPRAGIDPLAPPGDELP